MSLVRSLTLTASKAVATVILGGAILWEVALHCGPLQGTVYVHVSSGDCDVTIDHATYPVRTLWETPIVRKLQPGSHTVRMSRDGRVVFEQEFSIDAGEELVLTAWDEADKNLSETSSISPDIEVSGSFDSTRTERPPIPTFSEKSNQSRDRHPASTVREDQE
ncbi:MAG TPA: hypothetical protein VKA15_00905 [Isosphaeraceae bacterium]|nr:hypothetical protein [Isosphaeraceae bacterium]